MTRTTKRKRPGKEPTDAQRTVIEILRTADQMSRRFAAVVGPRGITLQQFNVLRILRGAGEPLPTMEIGARMIEKTPAITGLLDRLQKKRLIRRLRGAGDRRQVFCAITREGLDLLQQLDTPIAALDEACVAGLDPAERKQLIRLLKSMQNGLLP